MTAKPEPFNVDELISLEEGVQTEARRRAFFQNITDSADTEKWNEVVRFAYRAGWRVLPEILVDDSPDFFKPIKRYVFAASCRALFVATHPDTNAGKAINDFINAANAATFAAAHAANKSATVAINAARASFTADNFANSAAYLAADAAESAATERRKSLRQPLLLAMREDLIALQANQTLADRELWSKEAASLFDVNEWFGTFRKNLKLVERGNEIPHIYEALLEGRIEQVIDKYPPDLFEDFFKSAESDYQEWQRGHATDDKNSVKEPVDEATAKETKKTPRDTLHSELPSATDHLNQELLAGVLSTWLTKNRSHAAIGLFGDWGVGKSTFVNLLRRRLGIPLTDEAADDETPLPDHYKTADYIGGEFNAWQYEHTDNIQAGLAQELIAALQANLSWWEKKWLTWRYHSVDFFLTTIAVLVIVSIGNLVFYLKDASWFSWLEGFGGLVGIGGSLIGIGSLFAVFRYGANVVAHPLAKQLRTHLRLPSFVKELGTIPVMREQVRAMVNLRLNFFEKKQRLLFVVDDLDRCSPGAVVKVLETVRLIMDLPNVVVLIAIDQKIALASLALRYKELAIHYGADPKTIARQYLGKVIHVPITLDNPAPEAVENYLHRKLWAADDDLETATEDRPKDESAALDDDQPFETNEAQTDSDSGLDKAAPEVSEKPDPSPHTPEKQLESTPTQSTDSKDTQTQDVIESIGLSQGQKDAFIQWAHKLGLANPRHIKRLDNAYNLIRMRYPDEDEAGEPYYRLVMLMWIEYCRELPLDIFATFRTYVRAEISGEPDETVKPLREKVDSYNQQVSLLWDEVKAIWKDTANNKSPEDSRAAIETAYLQVRTFVLPAIRTDNFKSCAVKVTDPKTN